MLTEEEYGSLEGVLFDAAIGHADMRPESATRYTEGVDSDGNKYHVTQSQSAKPPSISLAAKLLEQRIGGPQDYC